MRSTMRSTLKDRRVLTRRGWVRNSPSYTKELARVRGVPIGGKNDANDLCAQNPALCQNKVMRFGQPHRAHMPQINNMKDLRRADAFLPAPRSFKKLPVRNLRFSQRDVRADLTNKIARSVRRTKAESMPIVVFEHPKNTFTVADGHHRVAAQKQLIREGKMSAGARLRARVYAMDPQLGLLILNSVGFSHV